jgi:hypothetical protein
MNDKKNSVPVEMIRRCSELTLLLAVLRVNRKHIPADKPFRKIHCFCDVIIKKGHNEFNNIFWNAADSEAVSTYPAIICLSYFELLYTGSYFISYAEPTVLKSKEITSNHQLSTTVKQTSSYSLFKQPRPPNRRRQMHTQVRRNNYKNTIY